jgi:hypothetical protein
MRASLRSQLHRPRAARKSPLGRSQNVEEARPEVASQGSRQSNDDVRQCRAIDSPAAIRSEIRRAAIASKSCLSITTAHGYWPAEATRDVFAYNECMSRIKLCASSSANWHGKRVRLNSAQEHIPLFDRNTAIPSSRPAVWQSTARSGSQGCRRDCGGTGGAGAQRPPLSRGQALDRASTVLG